MFHRAAAQHSHLGAGIEDREIDRRLQRRQCRFVQCVEYSRVAQFYDRGFSGSAHGRGAQVDRPISRQARQQVERFGTGQKHRVAQMAAGLRVGENMREENTVVYFKALLLLEGPRPLAAMTSAPGVNPGTSFAASGMSSSTRRNLLPRAVTLP